MANIMAVLGLEVDASGAVRGLRDVDAATDRTGKNVRELQQLLRALGLAWGVYEVVQFTKETIALADAYKTMQSRLALVSQSAENLADVQRDLYTIAQDARTPLESTALLYERLARVSGELGLSQAELLRHTETINKAMVISGTSAEGTRAALVQLSQGFAAGTLRGDELNAVLEQAPRLAQAIADGMGVSVGMLRRMGAEGKLTAEAVVDALEDQADAIDREFSGMEMTVGGAMTRLRNAWMAYVGEANEASGATSGLAEAINGLADSLEPAGKKVNAFFGGIALLAVDAAIAFRKLQYETANALPAWMLQDRVMPLRGIDRGIFMEEMEAYREEQYARITGVTARPSKRVYGAGLSDDEEGGTKPLTKEAERSARSYRELRQEMQDARVDLEQEVLDLRRSALAREYNRNALEHERRVRDILATQAPQYHDELIHESEALYAAANAHASRTQAMEREEERLRGLVDADHAAMEQLVAQEQKRREAIEQPFENAIENIQRAWGEMFTSVLDDARITADDLGDLFRRAAGEVIAGAAMNRLQSRIAKLLGADDDDRTLGQQINRDALGGAFAGAFAGYAVGQTATNGAGGATGGFMSGAAAGWMAGGPVGAAVGAFAGLIGGITGASEAAKRAREAQDAYRDSIEAMEAALRGDDIGQGIARIRMEMDALRRQLDESGLGGPVWKHGDPNGAYQQELERINTLEAERIRQLQEEYETMLRQTGEDLAVRALVAQGRDDEAARLRLQIQHQRELDELVKSIDADGTRTAAEEALLAQMLYTQELERTAQAMAGVNAQAANLPATFKMAGYAFDAMQEMTTDAYRRAVLGGGGSSPYPSAPPTAPAAPVPPAADAAGSGGTVTLSADHPIVLTLDGKVVARSTLREFVRGAAGPGKEQTAAILGDIRVS